MGETTKGDDDVYIYFVSFMHKGGFGNIEIFAKKKITSIQDIRAIEKAILDTERPCVMSYQLLDEVPDEPQPTYPTRSE